MDRFIERKFSKSEAKNRGDFLKTFKNLQVK